MSSYLFFFFIFKWVTILYKFSTPLSDIFAILPFLLVVLVIIFGILDSDRPQNLASIHCISRT